LEDAMTKYAVWVNGRFGGYKMREREGAITKRNGAWSATPPVATFDTAEAAGAALADRGFINSTFVDRHADGRTRLSEGEVTAYVILTDTKFLG
jgi:hypothetical protein